MQGDAIERLLNSPDYQRLVKARTRLGFALSGLSVGSFFALTIAMGAFPDLLSIRLGETPFTLGYPLAGLCFAAIMSAIVIYVRRTNKVFDRLADEIARKALAGEPQS